jgi:Tol biopolymer transport system component
VRKAVVPCRIGEMKLLRVLLAVFAVAAVVAVGAAAATDVTPTRTIDLSSAPEVVIANGPGDQNDSHVDGNLVAYSNHAADEVHYYDLSTGIDRAVPHVVDSSFEGLPDISGTDIVYRVNSGSAGRRVYEYDTADPSTPPHDVDPDPDARAFEDSIGGDLIAWTTIPLSGLGDNLFVRDRAGGAPEQLTTGTRFERGPAVAPSGAGVAWQDCQTLNAPCDVWSADRASAGSWNRRQLTTGTAGVADQLGTDGSIAAYVDGRGGTPDIYWQPFGGGPESHLVVDGNAPVTVNETRSVSHGVIVFDRYDEVSQPNGEFDIWAYDTNSGFLYRITDTPEDESLSDIAVSGHTATATWSRRDITGDDNVYAKTFQLQQPPHVTADHPQVSGNEGSQATNTGTVSDPNGDTVSLSASVGQVTNNGDGTWSWSYTPEDGPATQTVTITGTDPDGLSDSTTFDLSVNNVAPTAAFNAPSSATPGSTFGISLTGPSDPSSADASAGFTYSFDCGTGVFSPYGSSNSASCVAPATPGPVTVRGRIQDKDGGVSSYSAAVQVSAPSSPIVFTSTRDGNSEIYSMHADGGGVTRLTHNSAIDANAVWSPDHSKIAFVSTRSGASDIYTMNADGSGVTRLTSSHAIDVTPAWSPNGSKIAFASNRDGDFELYTMNAADGSGVTRVTNNHAQDATPSWSPDGSKLAFSSTKDGNVDIYTINLNGSGLTRLTTSKAIDVTPDWSPDGSRIAFSTDRDGNFEIYSMTPSGSGALRLTTNHAGDGAPAWTPDGSKIVFASDRDHNSEIYSMNANGSGATRLTNNPALDTLPDA